MTYNEAKNLIDGIITMREGVSDTLALKCKGVYPSFESLCEKKFTAAEAGYKFRYGEDLYRTVQPTTEFVDHFKPGVGTESMFERIDEVHTGSKQDPIPYSGNMRLELGKHYSQDGAVYECIRDSEIPIHSPLSELVDNYVKLVSEVTPVE